MADPNEEKVTIYPRVIAQAASSWSLTVPHLTMQTVIHEYIHTIQGHLGSPSTWLYHEYEAHNLSYYWYKANFRKNPPLKPYSKERYDAIVKSDKYKSGLKKVERWYERSKQRNLSESEEWDFNRAVDRLIKNLTHYVGDTVDLEYDKEQLECANTED